MQSTFAALLGYLYVLLTRPSPRDMPVFPSRRIVWPLALVAVVSSLSSPFGYASLAHVDYITFILAKSCKLVPVMLLHVALYRKRYPFYKYAVVALVTAGVAVFTLHQSSGSSKKGKKGADGGSSLYGLMLLAINLLFDGLTNSTQDDIYAKFRPYSGQQMMCALNLLSTALTTAYLLASPYLVHSGLGAYVGMDGRSAGELHDALAFISRHPGVGWDVLAFAACGALGQVFICTSSPSSPIAPFPIPPSPIPPLCPCPRDQRLTRGPVMTLATFGSLLLVTVTVTRKMLTMILSVFWFGHRLSGMQWLGVGLVFGGIGMEAELSKREKRAKEMAKGGKRV